MQTDTTVPAHNRSGPVEWFAAHGYNLGFELATVEILVSQLVTRDAIELQNEVFSRVFIDAPVAQLDRARLS